MFEQNFEWKRFWYLRGETIHVGDGGYLYDPDTQYGHIFSPTATSFANIATIPCLALLAEPGMGKSHSLQQEYDALTSALDTEDDQTLWIDLRSFSSEDRLVRHLSEHTKVEAWCNSTHRLHLFIDSLDEALLRIETVASLLVEILENKPVERLLLRIACRATDWPLTLERGLKRFWSEEEVGVYMLSPLRQDDVIVAAQTMNIDHVAFLREVARTQSSPLASKPVTLKLLLTLFQRHGQFPATQPELYHQGCRLLCEETNEHRRDTRRTGLLTADQRLTIAGRIAAATVFGNRYAVWTGLAYDGVPDEDITTAELVSDHNELYGDAAVREALATGLFTSQGQQRIGWAHQTYAEFLAAWHLQKQQTTLTQIMSLLVHPDDPEGKLVPQLHETAAWIASMNVDVFRDLVQREPEVLLRSNLAMAEAGDRENFVAVLLTMFEKEQLSTYRWDYHKLAHPNLAQQLRPYLRNKTKPDFARQAAIYTAQACTLQVMQEDLLVLALDTSEPLGLRVRAVQALTEIGDQGTKAKLKPLIVESLEEDQGNQLRGGALQALWPLHINAKELFAVLFVPEYKFFVSLYGLFIANEIVPRLQTADVPIALEWVSQLPSRYKLPSDFHTLINAIFILAWQHLDAPHVVLAFAQAALSRARELEPIVVAERSQDKQNTEVEAFQRSLHEHDTKRRKIVDAIIPLIQDEQRNVLGLVFSATPLVTQDDVVWLIEQLLEQPQQERRNVLAELVRRVLNITHSDDFERIYEACQQDAFMREQFASLFEPIELDSPQAKTLREWHHEGLERRKMVFERRLDPPPTVRMLDCLDRFEAGNVNGWWQLNLQMTLDEDSTHYGNELEADITTLPGWEAVDSAVQTRIIAAAHHYVLDGISEAAEWLGTTIIDRPARAGYRALYLLLCKVPDVFADLPRGVWYRWAPIIAVYPVGSEANDKSIHHELLARAYQHAPNAIINAMLTNMDGCNSRNEGVSLPSKFRVCWDDKLAQALFARVQDVSLTSLSFDALLTELILNKFAPAVEYAISLLSIPFADDLARQRALTAAYRLIVHAPQQAWTALWELFQNDKSFGGKVVESVADSGYRGHSFVSLTEQNLASLYIWLEQQYPHAEDPLREHGVVNEVTSRDSVAFLRGDVLRLLEQRATRAACSEIRRITGALPHLDGLKWTLREAEMLARRATWMPPSVQDILLLTSNRHIRLVQNGEQLLAIICESLKRLEAELQGETPAAIDVWNEKPYEPKYEPKDENRLSDYIKRHLDRDLRGQGIVINREVEIRRGEGGSKGERTDIRVDAVAKIGLSEVLNVISVIIEVKGCWHAELRTAMETQLVQRYLADNRCRHGLYLVGWFYCDQWEKTPKKYASMDDFQQFLNAQAVDMARYDVQVDAVVLDTRLR